MKSCKETVKIRVCKGGAWERVDGALEYMPLNCEKRTLILPLLSSYSCLLEAVFERLEIDANSRFMVTYNSDNDIVEVVGSLKHKKPSVFGKVKRLAGKDESSESDDESSESDEEGSESNEDEETTPVENKNFKVDKFWFATDGNNQILPLAYGVGESETFRSWDWFLRKLKECIIGKQDNLTIISDGAISTALTVNNVFPNAFHDFEERFSTLRNWLPSVANKLDMIGREKWAIVYFPDEHKHELTPWAEAKLAQRIAKSSTWTVRPTGNYLYNVVDYYKNATVNLNTRTCSSGQWQLSSLPCGNLIAVMRHLHQSSENYFAFSCFKTSVWRASYKEIIYDVGHPS
uniref:RNA-directed DNA polymerase, eukaryota, reverse transcriptase zinc-binding domain protein n=1 Tax=Tanacetum cinerariifolium TaxID=118510 RepID=A0A6L2NNN2_TANCI|nr:RNA-directed DNA polymerase, eukaryota, reverse transcriptase zinc-binding domain protein [Tanacetum cinerariifolium]